MSYVRTHRGYINPRSRGQENLIPSPSPWRQQIKINSGIGRTETEIKKKRKEKIIYKNTTSFSWGVFFCMPFCTLQFYLFGTPWRASRHNLSLFSEAEIRIFLVCVRRRHPYIIITTCSLSRPSRGSACASVRLIPVSFHGNAANAPKTATDDDDDDDFRLIICRGRKLHKQRFCSSRARLDRHD